ncbi:MAG: hypothetical protein AAF615_09830, partial [Pseudomonadota bacterium]
AHRCAIPVRVRRIAMEAFMRVVLAAVTTLFVTPAARARGVVARFLWAERIGWAEGIGATGPGGRHGASPACPKPS